MGGLSTRSGFVALQNPTDRIRSGILPELRKARLGLVDGETPDADRSYAVLIDISDLEDIATAVQMARAEHLRAPVIAVCAPGPRAEFQLLEAFRNGIDDALIMEDSAPAELVDTLKLALERRRLNDQSRAVADAFSAELGNRARRLLRANAAIEGAYESTLHALVSALDVREKATAGHSMRVSYYTCFLAILLGVDELELQDLYRGALLHDIGKIGIPDAILLKPAKLTDEEFEVMKGHTELGLSFLEGIDYLSKAIDIPYCHHEKWNGRGYPRGLSGEEIPLGARIFAIADVYDALRSKRCYKDAMTHERATEIIVGDSGSHFDPRVVEVFLTVDVATWQALDEAACRDENSFQLMFRFCQELLSETLETVEGSAP